MTAAALFALTADQAQELREHLAGALADSALDQAVRAIDLQAAICLPGRFRPGDWRRYTTARRRQMSAIAEDAARLLARLRLDPEGLGPGRPFVYADEWSASGLSWPAIEGALELLAAAARRDRNVWPRGARGAPPDEARDALVAVIHSVYPPGAAKRTRGSHFEDTVEIVLGYLGREVEDVHGLVRDALRRQPRPPFRVA